MKYIIDNIIMKLKFYNYIYKIYVKLIIKLSD